MLFRDRVRIWLRLSELATKNDMAILLSHMKAAEVQRGEFLLILKRIETKLTAAHIDNHRDYLPSELDWDTVQAIAAHQLRTQEPPKEWQ